MKPAEEGIICPLCKHKSISKIEFEGETFFKCEFCGNTWNQLKLRLFS